jgi:hypothetical protein
MAFVFHRGLTVPLWAVAVCAVALSAPALVMPPVVALLGIAVFASAMPAIARWLRPSHQVVDVLQAADEHAAPRCELFMTTGTRTRTCEEATDARTRAVADAVDLARMDDDGGWLMAPNQRTLRLAHRSEKLARD